MTTANAIQKRAGHFARRVREEPPPSRGIPRSGGHVRFPTGKLYATPGALAALERARDFGSRIRFSKRISRRTGCLSSCRTCAGTPGAIGAT